jgi:phytoene synthase
MGKGSIGHGRDVAESQLCSKESRGAGAGASAVTDIQQMQQPNGDRLSCSYAYCERLARAQAKNFYPAFRVLPGPKRRAMCALYAFLRIADDLSDAPLSIDQKRAAVESWRREFGQALQGEYRHELHPALHHAIQVFGVPAEYLWQVLDGVEMDLDIATYATFSELYTYCYRVASAVGLACIHIWGFRDEAAKELAEKAGIAFQLTNILRDLPEDMVRGRVYLPEEDLSRFCYSAEDLRRQAYDERFRNLMRFQVERARQYYDAARPLFRLLDPAGRAVFQVMAHTYRSLLDAIEERDYNVFKGRVSISRWRKLRLVMAAVPARLGWT